MTDHYISREKAITACGNLCPSMTTPDGSGPFDEEIFHIQEFLVDVMQTLNELPAADVRQVVHCKNCNLWFKDDKVGYENLRNVSAPCLYFSNLEDGYTVYTKPDDFCSYGMEVEE